MNGELRRFLNEAVIPVRLTPQQFKSYFWCKKRATRTRETSLHHVVNICGNILNEFLPADLFVLLEAGVPLTKITHLIISDPEIQDIFFLKDFTSLHRLTMNSFDGDLSPLRKLPIKELFIDSYTGDLSVLRAAPLRILSANKFTKGSLGPLFWSPLQELYMDSYEGDDLRAIRHAPLRILSMNSFTGNLLALAGKKLQQLSMSKYKNQEDVHALRALRCS
jgi:hypothetical protein